MSDNKHEQDGEPVTPEDAANDPGPAAEAPADEQQLPPSEREAALEAELEEAKDRLLRTLAEMENLRRRTERDVEEARRYAISQFARDLLEVADNLSRALASVPAQGQETVELVGTLADGVAMTEKALLGVLERHTVSKVEPAPGDRFDHNRHQAMFEVETERQPAGTIAQVLQPGYLLADRLLRPALVGVAKPPAPSAGGERGGEPRPGERVDTTA
jgi:molecular chaperone GrpE